MKRPIMLHTLALILGIFYAFMVNKFFAVLLAILFIIPIVIYASKKIKGMKNIVKWGVLLFFCIGAVEFMIFNSHYNNEFSVHNGNEVEAVVVIASEPSIKEKSTKYIVNVKKTSSKGVSTFEEGTALLYVSGAKSETLTYGQMIKIQGSLEKPRPKSNPGGFDYRLYLKTIGISASIFTKMENITDTGENHGYFLVKIGLISRASIVSIVDKLFEPQQAGLLNGILIGYREGLTKEIQQAFSNAGLTHIMAVSGANVLFIILPFAFIFRRVGIQRKYANIIIIIILCLFILITGFQASVMRAVLMAVVVLVGQMLRRESDFFSSISFAAMILLLLNPYTLFDLGFLLSFVATISLVMFYQSIKNRIKSDYIPEVFKDVLAGTIAAQVGVLPITLFFFNSLQIISLITNVLAVPITGIITIGGFVTVALGAISITLAKLVAAFVNLLLTFILLITKVATDFEYSVLHVATPPVILIFAYIAIAVMMYLKPELIMKKYKILVIGLLMYVFVYLSWNMFFVKLEMFYLDVGQGDATLIRTEGKTILVDGGGYTDGGASDKGESVIIPFLYDIGSPSIDLIISTHPDGDHIAGLLTILKNVKVKKVIVPSDIMKYAEMNELITEKGIEKEEVRSGDVIILNDNTKIEVSNPMQNASKEDFEESNITSIVFKMLYKNTSFLFCADIPQETEKKLIKENAMLEADVLKVSHHGSRGSTSKEFVDAVKPKAAIISVGKNMYGHPSRDVIERLTKAGAKVYRTDIDGAVVIKSDGSNIRIEKMIE